MSQSNVCLLLHLAKEQIVVQCTSLCFVKQCGSLSSFTGNLNNVAGFYY